MWRFLSLIFLFAVPLAILHDMVVFLMWLNTLILTPILQLGSHFMPIASLRSDVSPLGMRCPGACMSWARVLAGVLLSNG